MFAHPEDVTIIYRVHDENDAALLAETRELARIRGFKLIVLAGKRAQANSWMNATPDNSTDLDRLLEIAPNVKESDVYVCGPTAWTRAVQRTLNRAGTPKQQVHTEEYAW
jgi:ferredoxin-NADP reductase